MATWNPQIAARRGMRYTAIVERLAADIASGRLTPGTRLPTHRALAQRLGVTVGTVTRAYAEAERRGLVSGQVGRGTFVRPSAKNAVYVISARSAPRASEIDLSRNLPTVAGPVRAMVERHLSEIGGTDVGPLIGYGPTAGLPAHREAGAAWIARRIGRADPDNVVVSAGAQHGSLLALAALARPGDVVLCESLVFYGMKTAAEVIGVRLVGVEIDADGIVPEALDRACRLHAPRALCVVSTFHSPTTAVMPFKRRELVAAICRHHGVTIVEDDIYGFLDESAVPLAALAPDRSVYVTSLSKSVGGGLRLGYVHAPAPLAERIAGVVRATTNASPYLSAEIGARMIRSGDALRAAAWQRELAARRRALALDILRRTGARARPGASQVWLPLPSAASADAFAAAAKVRGVLLTPSSAFSVDGVAGPHGVRIALSVPDTDEELAGPLQALAELAGDHAALPSGALPALLSA